VTRENGKCFFREKDMRTRTSNISILWVLVEEFRKIYASFAFGSRFLAKGKVPSVSGLGENSRKKRAAPAG